MKYHLSSSIIFMATTKTAHNFAEKTNERNTSTQRWWRIETCIARIQSTSSSTKLCLDFSSFFSGITYLWLWFTRCFLLPLANLFRILDSRVFFSEKVSLFGRNWANAFEERFIFFPRCIFVSLNNKQPFLLSFLFFLVLVDNLPHQRFLRLTNSICHSMGIQMELDFKQKLAINPCFAVWACSNCFANNIRETNNQFH